MMIHSYKAIIMPQIYIAPKISEPFLEKWYKKHPLQNDKKLTRVIKNKMIKYINNDDEIW